MKKPRTISFTLLTAPGENMVDGTYKQEFDTDIPQEVRDALKASVLDADKAFKMAGIACSVEVFIGPRDIVTKYLGPRELCLLLAFQDLLSVSDDPLTIAQALQPHQAKGVV